MWANHSSRDLAIPFLAFVRSMVKLFGKPTQLFTLSLFRSTQFPISPYNWTLVCFSKQLYSTFKHRA